MTIIVRNFLEQLKSKPLTAYPLMAVDECLGDYLEEAIILYKYTNDKEDKENLELVYSKMASHYNSVRKEKIYKENLGRVKSTKMKDMAYEIVDDIAPKSKK